uniref:Cytochrome b-c1 complex subunit 7 n=2 Tax=Sus scrofa TaxID=9823 RepID=A0A8D1QUZ1_PIG
GRDSMVQYEDDNVREARRRLPEKLYNDRVFRIKRALVLTKRQQILPKKQWTNYEEDKSHLEPYLKGTYLSCKCITLNKHLLYFQ